MHDEDLMAYQARRKVTQSPAVQREVKKVKKQIDNASRKKMLSMIWRSNCDENTCKGVESVLKEDGYTVWSIGDHSDEWKKGYHFQYEVSWEAQNPRSW